MNIYEVLDKLNIEYDEIEHEAVFTVEEASFIKSNISGIGCKNLFLTDKKDRYILVLLVDDKKANIKQIENAVNISRLTFADEQELDSILKLKPGSVTPFGIINDFDNKVVLVIDKDFIGKKILFHPNINTKTVSITYDNLIKFIEYEEHEFILI